jgi:hypothetical protein
MRLLFAEPLGLDRVVGWNGESRSWNPNIPVRRPGPWLSTWRRVIVIVGEATT